MVSKVLFYSPAEWRALVLDLAEIANAEKEDNPDFNITEFLEAEYESLIESHNVEGIVAYIDDGENMPKLVEIWTAERFVDLLKEDVEDAMDSF